MPGSTAVYEVHNMVEKPKLKEAPSNLAVIGRYILTPTVFEILPKPNPAPEANCNSPMA